MKITENELVGQWQSSAYPLVSIWTLTFNHEKFIWQTIEGILQQKTRFAFEILIHDDASTDNTAAIIQEYAANYPRIIRPVYQQTNQWSGGIKVTQAYLWPLTRGKYIALCEGDDYWTDPFKLQKQVDKLEEDPDLSMVSSNFITIADDLPLDSEVQAAAGSPEGGGYYYGLDGITSGWKCQTLTVVFRKAMLDMKKLSRYLFIYDTMIFYELLGNGKGYYLQEITGVYRRHTGGVWNGISPLQRHRFIIYQFNEIWKRNKKDKKIRAKLRETIADYLRGQTFFTAENRRYYLHMLFRYFRITRNAGFIKLQLMNHVRYLWKR